jgi:hypothetical protein
VSHLALVLLAALAMEDGAAAPPATPALPGHMLPSDQRVPIPYELANGRIVFKINIAGREAWAVLDSAAMVSIADLKFARAAGLNLEPASNANDAQGAVTHRATDVPFAIPGQIEFRHPHIGVTDLGGYKKLVEHKVDLVLGLDVLGSRALFVDPGTRTLRFALSGGFPEASPVQSVALKNMKPPVIELAVGSETAQVVVATSAKGALYLFPDAWTRIVPEDARIEMVTLPGGDSVKSTKLAELQIGSVHIPDVEVRQVPQAGDGDGFIGMGLLGRFRLLLDFDAGTMVLDTSK